VTNLSELDDTSRPFAEAAAAALVAHFPAGTQAQKHTLDTAGRRAAGAVLHKLAEEMESAWEDDVNWPAPDQLHMIADELDGGAE